MVEQANTTSPCPRCRYDLSGLAPKAPCPECRLPAAAINSPMPIVIAEPAQIRRLARLIDVLGEVHVIWFPLSLMFALAHRTVGYGHPTFLTSVHEWGNRAAWFLILLIIMLVAWADRSMLSPPSFRRTRWLVLSASAAMLSHLYYLHTPISRWIPADIIYFGLTAADLAARPLGALVSLYLLQTARRSDERTLARRFRMLMWLMLAEVALGLFVSLVMRSWEVASSVYQVLWWIQFAFAFASIALGIFSIRLARHLRGPALAEATRVREKP